MNNKMEIKDANVYYGDFQALRNISLPIEENKITAFIGPSGCGKSTMLKSMNRMNDLVDNFRLEGDILLEDQNIYSPEIALTQLRKRVGMVFQTPNPFPMSIYDNIAYGPRVNGEKDRKVLDQIVEESLIKASLWDEVKDKLRQNATRLSGGQQQRLCIAERWLSSRKWF